MNIAEAVVLIVVISAIARTVRAAIALRGPGGKHVEFDHKGNPIQVLDTGPSPDAQAMRRELAELRERIKVLERIATDGRASRDLADEIDKLR